MITFDEFTDVARKHLNMSKKEMPEERLGSLWCALDADDSNQLQRTAPWTPDDFKLD